VINLDEVWRQLENVYDPELGLNIVELGLVYEVSEPREGDLYIRMTMTTPGCPMHDSIHEAVERAVMHVFGVADVKVDVVWDPPWTPELMTDQARAKLGF
jgi:metal-sulfur cluster biosynthetic enzyme